MHLQWQFVTVCCYICIGGACVYVHGREANPIMTQCTVSNANNVGIFVDDHARVSSIYLEVEVIYDNTFQVLLLLLIGCYFIL